MSEFPTGKLGVGTLREQIERRLRQPPPEPLFRVGERVRIRSGLTVNVHAIRPLLGRRGVVDRTQWAPLAGRWTYWVLVQTPEGSAREPFEADELDWRFRRRRPRN